MVGWSVGHQSWNPLITLLSIAPRRFPHRSNHTFFNRCTLTEVNIINFWVLVAFENLLVLDVSAAHLSLHLSFCRLLYIGFGMITSKFVCDLIWWCWWSHIMWRRSRTDTSCSSPFSRIWLYDLARSRPYMAHNGKMVMMMIVMAIIVTVINMMLWFTMAREMTIKIKMINARVKKARGALARLSGNFHISTH